MINFAQNFQIIDEARFSFCYNEETFLQAIYQETMKVMKFGGTSVGSAQRMKNMVALVAAAGDVTVVLSAMSGTTNSLLSLSQSILEGKTATH